MARQYKPLILALVYSLAIHAVVLSEFQFSPGGITENTGVDLFVTIAPPSKVDGIASTRSIGIHPETTKTYTAPKRPEKKMEKTSSLPGARSVITSTSTTPPKLLTSPSDPDATALGDEKGYINLELDIGSDGRVTHSAIMDSDLPEDIQNELAALSLQAIYEPATQNGERIPGKAYLRFEYHPAEPIFIRYQWIPDFQPDSG